MDFRFVNQIQNYSLSDRQRIYSNLKSRLGELQSEMSQKREKLKLCQLVMIESEQESQVTNRMIDKLETSQKAVSAKLRASARSQAYFNYSKKLQSQLAEQNKILKQSLNLKTEQFKALSTEVLDARRTIEKIQSFISLIDKLEVLEVEFLENEDIKTVKNAFSYASHN